MLVLVLVALMQVLMVLVLVLHGIKKGCAVVFMMLYHGIRKATTLAALDCDGCPYLTLWIATLSLEV